MNKECSCKKIIKDDKVTLINECKFCYKKKNKTFKLCIKLAELIIKINTGKGLSKQPIPDYQKGYVNKGDLNIIADGKNLNYKETIVTPNGKLVTPKNQSVILTGQLGSCLYSQEEWNTKINHILRSKGLNDSQPFGFAPIENDFQKGMLEADKELQRAFNPCEHERRDYRQLK